MKTNNYNPKVERLSYIPEKNLDAKEIFHILKEKYSWSSDHLQKIIWHGGLYLNGQRLEEKLPALFPEGSLLEIYRFAHEPENIPLLKESILFQEDGIFAFDKPAWLPIQGSRASQRYSLEAHLREWTGIKTLSAVHRLDRQTSGVVLFAENKVTEARLMKLFHDQKMDKTYLAWTSNIPKEKNWEMKGFMQRDFRRLPQNVYRFYSKEVRNSKRSRTQFEVLETKNDFALVRAHPFTGRTHQIRVHLSYSHASILGDDIYGGKMGFSERILLHAHTLNFDWGKKKIELEAPVPKDFTSLLS